MHDIICARGKYMKKKILLALVASFSVAISAVGAIVLTGNNDIKLGATDNYTCELPAGYHEIQDVIDYLVADDDGNCQNPYKFRGTVTKVIDDEAYVQRVNQTTLKLDAIKVTGFSDCGLSLSPGNVLDFDGGHLVLINEQARLIIEDSSQAFVSFTTNPTGYGPKTYGSYVDLLWGEFEDSIYAYSKLATISNAKYISQGTAYIYGTTYDTLKFEDLTTNMYFTCLLVADYVNVNAIIDTANDAKANEVQLSLTGIYTHHKSHPSNMFLITSADDVAPADFYVDLNVINEHRTGYTVLTSSYLYEFDYYTLIGKDQDIIYVNFAEFFLQQMPHLVLNEQYCHLLEYGYTDENTYVYLFDQESVENYLYIFINAVDDTISFYVDALHIFSPISPIGGSPRYIADGIETEFCQITGDSKVLVNPSRVSYDLGHYGIDIVKDKYNNMYIPINVLSNILFNAKNIGLGFNGRHLFYLNNTVDYQRYPDMIGWYFYDTPWSDIATRSQDFANYTYNEFCFLVENFYGLYEQKIPVDTNIDAIITSKGLKSAFLSTDTATYEGAMCDFVATWIADGHALYYYSSPYVVSDYVSYGNRGRNYSGGRNDRVYKLNADFAEIGQLKADAGKEVGLETYGDTAVIRFDSFVKYSPQDLDDDGINEKSSDINLYDYTYAQLHDLGSDLLFKRAFEEIEAMRPTIKNVVVDIVNNGGGMIDSLPFLEAYFTNDPSITVRDKLTGEVIETHYALDLDFDGTVYDTHAGEYDYFLLTSNASFSCGNYFPTVIKEKGAMTIIGEQSGGGECAVGMFASASGTIIRNSSFMHLGYYDYVNEEFVGNDGGITPDYAYPREKFYDMAYLVDFIAALKA